MEVLSSRLILATPDLGRARAFYEDTLGLHIYREYGADGAVTGVVYFLGGGFLEVTGGGPPDAGGAVKLWIQVADAGAEEARLRRAGVVVTQPAARMPWGLVELWIRDPHGLDLCLVQVPGDHPLRRRVD